MMMQSLLWILHLPLQLWSLMLPIALRLGGMAVSWLEAWIQP